MLLVAKGIVLANIVLCMHTLPMVKLTIINIKDMRISFLVYFRRFHAGLILFFKNMIYWTWYSQVLLWLKQSIHIYYYLNYSIMKIKFLAIQLNFWNSNFRTSKSPCQLLGLALKNPYERRIHDWGLMRNIEFIAINVNLHWTFYFYEIKFIK